MTEKRFKVCDYPDGEVLEDLMRKKELDDINCLCDLLNEQDKKIKELETDNFNFSFTEDYERINNNKLEVNDKHTKIRMDGETIQIIIIPPNTERYSFKYYITGITFDKFIKKIKDGDGE
jgi:hypothetical protein